MGCDSFIILNLSINTIDTGVTQNKNILTANSDSATYQWLDCNISFLPIPRETKQLFTATSNGDFAVEITKNNCTDTSACYTVNNMEIIRIGELHGIKIYPIPTTHFLTIQYTSNQKEKLTIYNILSELVYKDIWEMGETQKSINVASLNKGIYMIRIGDMLQKIVKE